MVQRVAIIGASGRMGSQLVKLLPEFPEFALSAALVSEISSIRGAAVDGTEIRFSTELEAGIQSSDLVIDFSAPATSVTAAKHAARYRRPILIGTTGFTSAQVDELRELSSRCAMAVVPNTSVGVFALREIAATAAELLGPSFDVEILELHHRKKKDAPSGTALALSNAVRAVRELEVASGRATRHGARADTELGIESLRGGDVVGEHTVFFLGQGERLELTHRVTDRAVFARGALRLAVALQTKLPGFYSVADLLSAS